MSKSVGFLALHIIAARDLAAADRTGKSDPYVKISSHGKKLGRTATVKQDLNPVWNACFLLPAASLDGGDLVLDVFDHDTIGRDDFLGFVTVTASVPALSPNVVHKHWLRLVPRTAADVETVKGEISVAYVWLTRAERLVAPLDVRSDAFCYRSSQFRVGDLVLFSGCGRISGMLKAYTASEWTHAALVVALPNVATGVPQRFLLELTAWSRLAGRRGWRGGGVRLLPVDERVHEAHAYAVAHCPREVPLPEGVGAELNRHALELWMQTNQLDAFGVPAAADAGADLQAAFVAHHAHEDALGDAHAVRALLCEPDEPVRHALKEADAEIKPHKTAELLDLSLKAVLTVLAKAKAGPSYARLLDRTAFVSVVDVVNADGLYASPVCIRLPGTNVKRFPAGMQPFRHGEKMSDAPPAAPAHLSSHPSLSVDRAPPDPLRRASDRGAPSSPRAARPSNNYGPAPAALLHPTGGSLHPTPAPPSPRFERASVSAPPLTIRLDGADDDDDHLPSYHTVVGMPHH